MFDVSTWRAEVQRRFQRFIRRPRQEAALFGTERLFLLLASRVMEPFFEHFTYDPLEAVQTLGELTRNQATAFLIHNAVSLRYQHQLLWQRLERSAKQRATLEQIILKLEVVPYLLQELGDVNGEWFRTTLRDELDEYRFSGELVELRQLLNEPSWQTRYAAIQSLNRRGGNFNEAELTQLSDALDDHSAHVRAAAARQLGASRAQLSAQRRQRLLLVALQDRDVGTRYAAARAVGMQREAYTDSAYREVLVTALFHEDPFVRSAACMVLTQLGTVMADASVIDGLLVVLQDADAYAREAAATALGHLGPIAATAAVIQHLTDALLDTDQYVHEAALASLRILQPLRPS